MSSEATFELDHLFFCTEMDAPVAARLAALGLCEGPSNVHPGQGTANRRFFFHNAMVELLWVHDPAEAQSEPIRRTQLWERCQGRTDRDVCPFAFCLRPIVSSEIASEIVPNMAPDIVPKPLFSSWDFRPPYLPASLSIQVATNSDRLAEPMLFQTPFSKRPDQRSPDKQLPLDHPLELKEITRLTFVTPPLEPLSPELQSVLARATIEHRIGTQYCVELGFDDETQGQQADMRSELPLVLSW